MQELEHYIKSNVSVTIEEAKVISTYFRTTLLKKGDYFVKAGRYCERLSFIKSGHIRVFVEATDREVTQWIAPPGYFITDLSSFVSRTVAKWNMQALTDCEILEISRDGYDQLGKEVPVWKDLDRLFIVKCFGMLEARIFNHLYMSTEERFSELMKTQPELFNIVPLQYLASMLGMTPETLSRLRKKIS
jgi:CRP/FNR family transcriptional regulator, anaerobic regulatory protein